ncbi:Hypothetical predicted protein [Cloeon dipterum]|uniref:Pentacotripeptide-repeat region of PRORP domain-containing protein n=1 Tax=Cloeon dipterum TaxID=197152 RepID=A0A8S1DDL0_9INSE|nr:Hypothetical predicted protein [Cloeon dipterum]
MISIRSLLRPCRAASRVAFRRIPNRNNSSFYAGPADTISHQENVQNNRLFVNNKIDTRFSTLSTVLNPTNEAPEPVSRFEFFRARALKKGRVNERETETLLEFLSQGAIEEGQCAFMLNCCAEYLPHLPGIRKVELAEKIWNTFPDQGRSKLDVLAFLNVHIAATQEVKPEVLLKLPLLEDKEVLQLLLESHAECGNVAKCSEIVERMKSLGFAAADHEFACLILAHGTSNNYKGVQSVLERMDLTGVNRGRLSLFSLLRVQILNEIPVIETLKMMHDQGVKLDDEQVAKVVVCLSKTNKTKLVGTILRQFPVYGLGHVIRNMVIHLIYEGKHVFASEIFHLLLADSNTEILTSMLAFFPSELVKSGKSASDILDICLALQSNFPNHNPFLSYAVEESLRDKSKMDFSSALLVHMTPLRSHYFWPLIVHSSTTEEAVDVLQQMLKLGLQPNYDTLTFYLYPSMLRWDAPIKVIKLLQEKCHLSFSTQLGPMLCALLVNKQIEEALHLCKLIKDRTIDLKKLYRPMAMALLEKKSYAQSAELVASLAASRHKFSEVDFVGLFLCEFANRCQPTELRECISHLAKYRLRISMASYELLSTRPSMKQAGIQYLDLLTDTSFSGVESFQPIPHPKNMDIEEMEAHLIELKSKSMNTRGILRKLLMAHCKAKNVERALHIKTVHLLTKSIVF